MATLISLSAVSIYNVIKHEAWGSSSQPSMRSSLRVYRRIQPERSTDRASLRENVSEMTVRRNHRFMPSFMFFTPLRVLTLPFADWAAISLLRTAGARESIPELALPSFILNWVEYVLM